MKMTMKKTVSSILLVMMVAVCFTGCGSKSGGDAGYTAKNTEFVIGATGPLTGDASSYGISVQKGAQLAIEQINADGGLNGIKFKLDMKDDKATAADAAIGYDTLYESGMQVSLGSVTSASCDSFASKAVEDNVFVMTPSASAANVIKDRDNAFRICFGDPDQGTLAAEELTKNYKKIGAIYDTSDAYSAGIYKAFKDEMKKLKVDFDTQTFDGREQEGLLNTG